MGSWRQALGQAFNALTTGCTSSVAKPAWATGRSESSGSLSGAEPSSRGSTSTCESEQGSGPGLSPASAAKKLARQRRSYFLGEQQELGHEACEFRDWFLEEKGTVYGWATAFLAQRFHVDDMRSPKATAMRKQLKGAVRTALGGQEQYRGRQGRKALARQKVINPRMRKRRSFGPRNVKCPIISEELWSWFVDRLHAVPGRVGTQLLVDQANIVSGDVYDDWLVRRAQGQADASCPPDLPQITRNWVDRWRRAYGVTFRTVNLRYKISHSKRILRLRVFWSNVLRVRLLHEYLFGRDGIDFLSVDQKPLYFNSSLACKTLAPKGAKKVNVKESVADSRERFSLMTACVSWMVSRAPGLATLFRYDGAEDTKISRSVQARRNGLVQWAPKGSYRLSHVLAYLRWAVREGHAVPDRPPTNPAGAEDRARARAAAGLPAERRHLCTVLDWFAPHLDDLVDEELEQADSACLRIGGGLTGDVQVCDTHRHGPLTTNYRGLEGRDSRRQLKLRPQKLPSFTRQHVFNRSMEAWAQTSTGVDGRKEWVQNACLNALDGSEDGQIAKDLFPLWMHIGMPRIREQLREEIKAEVQAGRLHSFWQYSELLEPYDDHEGLREGMEDAEIRVHDDDADESSDDDDVAPGRDEEQRDMEELPEGGDAAGGGPSARSSSSTAPACAPCGSAARASEETTEPEGGSCGAARASAPHGPEAGASVGIDAPAAREAGGLTSASGSCCPGGGASTRLGPEAGLSPLGGDEARASAEIDAQATPEIEPSGSAVCPDLRAKAEAELGQNKTAKHLKALADAAALLREVGDTTQAQSLEQRAHMIMKAAASVGDSTRLFLMARSIERAEHERREQEAASREDERKRNLDARLRLAKEETAAKKAVAGEAAAEARKYKLDLEVQRRDAKALVERQRSNLAYVQQHLAADLVAKAKAFLRDAALGESRVEKLRALAKKSSGGKHWLAASRAVLDPVWDGGERGRYVVVTPSFGMVKKKTADKREWASERMARALFGGRDPKEAKTAEATGSRLSRLLAEYAPGYDHKLFKGCHLAHDLLERNARNVDLCVIMALRRYCLLVPEADYPCDIRSWPWDAEQMDRWVEAHKAAEEQTGARALTDEAAPAEKLVRASIATAPRPSKGPLAAPSGLALPAAASCGSASSACSVKPGTTLARAMTDEAEAAPRKKSLRMSSTTSGLGDPAAASKISAHSAPACSKGPPTLSVSCAPPAGLYSKWADAPG